MDLMRNPITSFSVLNFAACLRFIKRETCGMMK